MCRALSLLLHSFNLDEAFIDDVSSAGSGVVLVLIWSAGDS